MKKNKTELYCSFCGRAASDVRLLIPGQGGCICNDCVEQAGEIVKEYLHDEQKRNIAKANDSIKDIPTPQEIKEYIDQYVIGQDDAKKYLSVEVSAHIPIYPTIWQTRSMPKQRKSLTIVISVH